AATDEMVRIAVDAAPDQVTLVPELPNEVTTTGGLDCLRNTQPISAAIQRLQSAGIPVSLFIDPDEAQIRAARDLSVHVIEINTPHYADVTLPNRPAPAVGEALAGVRRAAEFARSCNITVLAGHGLTYRNVGAIAAIEPIVELNIGHNIMARAV